MVGLSLTSHKQALHPPPELLPAPPLLQAYDRYGEQNYGRANVAAWV